MAAEEVRRPIWISRGRAEDAGLEDAWDEDQDRFDEICTRLKRIRDTHTGGARTHADAILALMNEQD